MHEKLAISHAVIVVAGSILVAAGMLREGGEIVAVVGAGLGLVGLRGWYGATRDAKHASSTAHLEREIQAHHASTTERS